MRVQNGKVIIQVADTKRLRDTKKETQIPEIQKKEEEPDNRRHTEDILALHTPGLSVP